MKNFFLIILILVTAIASKAQTYDVTNFGAVGNGSTVNTTSIQAAIDSCTITGGTVLIPSGTFLTGTIILKSNVTLQVDGTLKGSPNINLYSDIIPSIHSITDGYQKKALIYSENQQHIGIKGTGTIDGNGLSFLGANERPFGIRFISCTDILYENIELRNAPFWMMHNFNVDTLTIRNITVTNTSNSNNDGIGIDGCRNVVIENCSANSFDDALVLKTTGPFDCKNVVVRNCTLSTVARAIKIGTETVAGFQNILIENCVVNRSLADADCGINVSIVDGGYMDSVTLHNITIEGVKTALFLRLGNQGKKYEPSEPTPPVGSVKNIVFRNIQITASSNLTSSITGIPGHYIEGITLDSITINFPGGAAAVRPGFVVPENETSRPNCDVLGDTLPAHGLYIRHVKNILMSNVCFNATTADQRPALVTEDVIESPQYTAVQTGTNQFCLPQIPLNIKQVDHNNFTIIPEPQTGLIRINSETESGNRTVEIFDVTGKRLLANIFPQRQTVEIFRFSPGIYFCTIKSDKEICVRKFLWGKN